MIGTRTVLLLSLSQFLCWGTAYYMIGVFGSAIATETGWALPLVYSGFSGALIVMGLVSGPVGRLIDRHGGRRVMTAGSALMAAAFLGLALSRTLFWYDLFWALLGIAMRMTLYEAAFATLAHLGGAAARGPISKITLLGGLASAVFWPAGSLLVASFGWRNALLVYAGIALLGMVLHWLLPDGRGRNPPVRTAMADRPRHRRDLWTAALLFSLMNTLYAFLNSGLSAHMIGIMGGFGLTAGAAVALSSLRGIGQSLARLMEILACGRSSSLALGVIASAAVLVSVAIAAAASGGPAAAGFAFLYGVGIGLLTIVRGIQPLELFDTRSYGALSGWMLMPGFFASAFAPVVYAGIIERHGSSGAIHLSLLLALGTFACAVAIRLRFRR